MFQFSKVMEIHKQKLPEQYFGSWILWFESRGIKTEIRPSRKGPSLWREGIEATEGNIGLSWIFRKSEKGV